MYLNISGEKLGIPLKCNSSPLVSVSPILKFPVSGKPTISPAKASSTVSFFCAIKAVGLEKRIILPWRTCL